MWTFILRQPATLKQHFQVLCFDPILKQFHKFPHVCSYHVMNKLLLCMSYFHSRAYDIKEKKFHVPLVDRTPVEPPPVLVAVVGPPKVGKSTLINCLIKNFTRQKLSEINGPVTIVSGKVFVIHRLKFKCTLLTFITCINLL